METDQENQQAEKIEKKEKEYLAFAQNYLDYQEKLTQRRICKEKEFPCSQ